MPKLSVLISTYNRQDYLHLSLDSLVAQAAPSSAWELIIVDNNSSDDTAQLIDSYRPKIGNMRSVFEPRQGISYARNRAAEEAQAPFIVYLDDDAEAPQTWVVDILAWLQQNPQTAAFGGPVIPNWEGPQPQWLPKSLLGYFTWLDYGEKAINLTHKGGVLLGANIGFKKSVFLEHGGFSTNLGRIGKNLLSGEETQLLQKIKASEQDVWYLPNCGVKHLVLPERRNPNFLINRMYGDGLSQVIIDMARGHLVREKLGRRLLFEYKNLLIEIFKTAKVNGLPEYKVLNRALVARRKGRIRQLWQEWLKKP